MLVLFDIDGTLLLTRGAGVRAMTRSGRELFGPSFTLEGIDYSGALDPLIYREAIERNGLANGEAMHAPFRTRYRAYLEDELAPPGVARLLPGVAELLARLEAMDGVTLGLVTGNYPETGRLKIERAGVDPDRFVVAGWGDDGPSRRHLPPIATGRFAARTGRAIDADRVVVIGDTIHDVDCAKANGHRVLAVATGGPRYSASDLAGAGADLVVDDLSRTDEIVGWLLAHGPAGAASSSDPEGAMT